MDPNNNQENIDLTVTTQENFTPVIELVEETSDKISDITNLNLSNFNFVRIILNKEQNWHDIYLDFSKFWEIDDINTPLISLLETLYKNNFYIDWISKYKIWNYYILDLLYKIKFFKKNLKQSFFKIWTIKKSNWEWLFKPELKTDISLIENQNTKKFDKVIYTFAYSCFKIWNEYNDDELIMNLWNWFNNPKNWVKSCIYYDVIFATTKFLKKEISKEVFLKIILDIYYKKWLIDEKEYKLLQIRKNEIEKYLLEKKFIKIVWTNLYLQIAKDILPAYWVPSKIELVSSWLIYDSSPEDKSEKWRIDLKVYKNSTFSVKQWEIIMIKIPKKNWKIWTRINWEKIPTINWQELINLELIAWDNLRIWKVLRETDKKWEYTYREISKDEVTQKNKNDIFDWLICTVNWYCDKFDEKKPTKKLHISIDSMISWVNKNTWDIDNDIFVWVKEINWWIHQNYQWTWWTDFIVKWDIDNNANFIISTIDSNINFSCTWVINNAKLYCIDNWNIVLNKVSNWSIIYAPNSKVTIKHAENWVIIIADEVEIDSAFIPKIIICNKLKIKSLTLWQSDTLLSWKKTEILNIENKSWDLHVLINWKKLQKWNIDIYNKEKDYLETKLKELQEHQFIKSFNIYQQLKLALEQANNNPEFASKKEALTNRLNQYDIDDLNFKTKNIFEAIETIENRLVEVLSKIEIYNNELNEEKYCNIDKIPSWNIAHITLWTITNDVILDFMKKSAQNKFELAKLSWDLKDELALFINSISTQKNKNYSRIDLKPNIWSIRYKLN